MASAKPDKRAALDHIVVVMFENRSFDNLLGRLYQPGEVASFEGVIGKDLSNPVPGWVEDRGPGLVRYGVARNMDTPNPDPGEEYQHVNTQLFGLIDPPVNRGKLAPDMIVPFNAPPAGRRPTMDGFVADYISAFWAEMGRQPSYDEYAQIMQGYTPEQMPVLSALARGFTTFDHWFAEVPSQTLTNRSFFHAATASGFVVNAPAQKFPQHNRAETIFERLEAAGLSWRVYVDTPSPMPVTALTHAQRLRERFATNFSPFEDFLDDAARGKLPTYTFIEPNIWHGHNDMHPPVSALAPGMALDAPSSLLGGEEFLARIYNAIRSASRADGSNCFNTLLMIAFDEHGGTYDHVPPPPAPPPDPSAPSGQMGFTFDRFGVRLPAVAISAWSPSQNVVNDLHHHTSVIQTLRKRWNLGQPLTARDACAPDLAPILTLDKPRLPEEWPDVIPRPVPKFEISAVPRDAPLAPLPKSMFHACLAILEGMGQKVPEIAEDSSLSGGEATDLIRESAGKLFPALKRGFT